MAYSDKVIIDRDSIRYEYKPVVESEINTPRKWSYFRNHTAEDAYTGWTESGMRGILWHMVIEKKERQDAGT